MTLSIASVSGLVVISGAKHWIGSNTGSQTAES
jgi:hypothetical protein